MTAAAQLVGKAVANQTDVGSIIAFDGGQCGMHPNSIGVGVSSRASRKTP
jgi:hypothetical protein